MAVGLRLSANECYEQLELRLGSDVALAICNYFDIDQRRGFLQFLIDEEG